MAELIRFKFPSLANSITTSIDNLTQGMSHINNIVTDAPEKNYGSCMAFPNLIYTPQFFITWNSALYIGGSISKEIKWKKVLTEDV